MSEQDPLPKTLEESKSDRALVGPNQESQDNIDLQSQCTAREEQNLLISDGPNPRPQNYQDSAVDPGNDLSLNQLVEQPDDPKQQIFLPPISPQKDAKPIFSKEIINESIETQNEPDHHKTNVFQTIQSQSEQKPGQSNAEREETRH